ncbi:alpha/beta hydrolase [bacterium]|nr:alpha/beta hydrolase [bacterium]
MKHLVNLLLATLTLVGSTHTGLSKETTHQDITKEIPMVHYIDNPDGRTAYELTGPEEGPIAILIPGMGDSRHVYRFLVPQLHEAGWRTAAISLRGHDESSTTYSDYSSKAVGQDVVALIDTLKANEVALIGNSMGGPVSVWAAAERPDKVKGIVMLGPFVREMKVSWLKMAMFKLALMPPWGKSAWLSVMKGAYVSQKPADFNQYMSDLDSMLSASGHFSAVRKTFFSSHSPAIARTPEVKAPVLVIFGEKDKDFPDPADEMRQVAEIFQADTLLVEGSGHYPQAEFPEITSNAITSFLEANQ